MCSIFIFFSLIHIFLQEGANHTCSLTGYVIVQTIFVVLLLVYCLLYIYSIEYYQDISYFYCSYYYDLFVGFFVIFRSIYILFFQFISIAVMTAKNNASFYISVDWWNNLSPTAQRDAQNYWQARTDRIYRTGYMCLLFKNIYIYIYTLCVFRCFLR